MNVAVFSRYARYYELLYRDKDYGAETRLVEQMLREAGVRPASLLDVGCGTGAHAREFATRGWDVTGVDASPTMIAIAEARKPTRLGPAYVRGRAAEFALGRKFSAAVSLFHVASYHTGPDELRRMCGNVGRHLDDDGVFVFDFWHGPGVLAAPPEVRVRKLEGEQLRVTRTATPTHHAEDRIVEVHYDLVIEDTQSGETERLSETHRMRYFFLPEIVTILTDAGYAVAGARAGISDEELNDRSWYGLVIAKAAT